MDALYHSNTYMLPVPWPSSRSILYSPDHLFYCLVVGRTEILTRGWLSLVLSSEIVAVHISPSRPGPCTIVRQKP